MAVPINSTVINRQKASKRFEPLRVDLAGTPAMWTMRSAMRSTTYGKSYAATSMRGATLMRKQSTIVQPTAAVATSNRASLIQDRSSVRAYHAPQAEMATQERVNALIQQIADRMDRLEADVLVHAYLKDGGGDGDTSSLPGRESK
mgnify:FL=1